MPAPTTTPRFYRMVKQPAAATAISSNNQGLARTIGYAIGTGIGLLLFTSPLWGWLLIVRRRRRRTRLGR